MTEAEKEIIRLLNQILQKLPDSPKPKYETKVDLGVYENYSKVTKQNNNEKTEEA